jgi:acyl-CoA synthetase (AMP-forming)/AMP-acid ligase II
VEGHRAVIVDPGNQIILGPGEIGEIWFSGASVASGYWRKQEATATTFKAATDCAEGPFLRTGDLGFLHNGGLFVTGRIKELIIFRGRNLYPHDIETTLVTTAASTSEVVAAVFATYSDGETEIVAYVEMPRRIRDCGTQKLQSVASELRAAVASVHEVYLRDIFFLSQGSIPRTSSGKTQRSRCVDMYASGEIDLSAQTLFSTRASRTLDVEAALLR